jgi:hypothetical protein
MASELAAKKYCFRRLKIISVLILVAWATSCHGQSPSHVAATAPPAGLQSVYEPGDLYLPSSRVYVFVGKTGLGHEHGVIGAIKQGRINLSAARDAGGLQFDMTTFTADTPDARKYVGLQTPTDDSTRQQVTANMRGPDVLNVTKFPTASFTIKEIAQLPQRSQRGSSQYQLKGDLWLCGISRPIQLTAEAEMLNGWTHLRGGFTMRQTDFGIRPFSKAFGALGVTDQLTVWGDVLISNQRQVASQPSVTR